jgi:hypothetical protein
VSRGASHHRSVRRVLAEIAARGLAVAGLVAVVVMFVMLPDGVKVDGAASA